MSSENMVERVARAIDPECWAEPGLTRAELENCHIRRQKANWQARVAIQVMREPTDAMIEAGYIYFGGERCSPDESWEAMIDAALSSNHTPDPA